MSTALTKLDVAHRQLTIAIRLFFDNRDAVSVYSLAANAWEIVDVLCKIRDVNSYSREAEGRLPDGQLLRHLINQPYRNFFKHADQDPEGVVEGFYDKKNDHLLFMAVEDLLRLEQTKLFECQIFQLWYLAVYTEKIAAKDLERVLPKIRFVFPNIRQLSRTEQKIMGMESLKQCSKDEQLLAHPRTNTSELNRWEGRSPLTRTRPKRIVML